MQILPSENAQDGGRAREGFIPRCVLMCSLAYHSAREGAAPIRGGKGLNPSRPITIHPRRERPFRALFSPHVIMPRQRYYMIEDTKRPRSFVYPIGGQLKATSWAPFFTSPSLPPFLRLSRSRPPFDVHRHRSRVTETSALMRGFVFRPSFSRGKVEARKLSMRLSSGFACVLTQLDPSLPFMRSFASPAADNAQDNEISTINGGGGDLSHIEERGDIECCPRAVHEVEGNSAFLKKKRVGRVAFGEDCLSMGRHRWGFGFQGRSW